MSSFPVPVFAGAGIFGSSRNLWGKSSLGARLRTRKVTGRDASLPAPLLATSLGLVGRGTVGALPQTPAGTLSLHPARGRRKGTKSPLDPFSRLSWSRFHAPSACSFLALRLSPCLLPNFSCKTRFFLLAPLSSPQTMDIPGVFWYTVCNKGCGITQKEEDGTS